MDIALLMALRRGGHLQSGGTVAEIGAQQLSNAFLRATSELQELGGLFGKSGGYTPPAPVSSMLLDGGSEHQSEHAPYARPFWEWLGYRYTAIDIDDRPDSIPLDLNYDEVPQAMKKQCRLVTNYGTTEHVANQLQAFKIIHDLTAVGGIMIHNLPAHGMINHGLVNYNPKFFWMLSRSNEYRFLFMDFFSHSERYALPQNIVDAVQMFDPNAAERLKQYTCEDATLLVALQKTRDQEYVPPIDVPNGSKTNNPVLRKRYWTVFAPSPPAGSFIPPRIRQWLKKALLR